MVNEATLESQLHAERAARLHATEHVRELQQHVELLRLDAKRREFELEAARVAMQFHSDRMQIQDLIEHNLALQEQVQSLKAVVQELQQNQTQHENSAANMDDDNNNKTSAVRTVKRDDSIKRIAEQLLAATELAPEELINRHDIQQLLANLAAKESQLQLLHQKCASWEQQVIELKFEMQAIKHNAQERDELTQSAQHSVVRQECCASCKEKSAQQLLQAFKREKAVLASVVSPKAPRTDVEHYKSLAHLRGLFWLQAREKNETFAEKLAQERKENTDLRNKMDAMEERHQSRAQEVESLRNQLERARGSCQLLEEQLTSVQEELDGLLTTNRTLTQEVKDARLQHQLDKRRSARIIMDLRGELNKQLMDLEQLHNASLLFSPRNSRGIDTNRKCLPAA